MTKFLPFLAILLAGQTSAFAASNSYLDDRSDAVAVIRSLYNAIDRKEYARAYSYFATPPAKSLDEFTKGYADTASVDLLTGKAAAEGAAGSIYYSLPVAIKATMTDGSTLVFAGCYTLRLAQPQIQGVPYRPMRVEKGELKPAKGPLSDALPNSCGEGPAATDADTPADDQSGDDAATPADALLEKAKAQFAAIYSGVCDPGAAGGSDDAAKPEAFPIAFNYPTDEQDEPKREARLFRFWCTNGAYNEAHVYFLANEDGEVTPLHFATPELDIRYRDDDPQGDVDQVAVVGYTAQDRLINSDYDAKTLTLTAHAKWRGAGDASATGTWIFRSGTFSLVRYDVDASYDNKINPETVLDYNSGP